MKTIINSQVKIKNTDDKLMLRSDLLKVIVNTPPEKGLSITEMKDRIRILDILDNCKSEEVFKTAYTLFTAGDIRLEDADFNTLKKLYDAYNWAMIHVDIIELSDHLEELSKTK